MKHHPWFIKLGISILWPIAVVTLQLALLFGPVIYEPRIRTVTGHYIPKPCLFVTKWYLRLARIILYGGWGGWRK